MCELQTRFLALLQRAQKERPSRQKWSGDVPEWVNFEGATMLRAVNAERTAAGKQTVDMAQLRHAEQGALGHCDYTTKFALYCAELAKSM